MDEHMDEHDVQESDSMQEILRPLAEDPVGEHPDPEELLHFQLGELESRRSESVAEHVALCVQCTETLADLEDFPDLHLGPNQEPVSDDDVQELWQAIEGHIASLDNTESEPLATPQPTSLRPPKRSAPWSSLLWLRAASIVLMASTVTFGGLWWQSASPAPRSPVLTTETLILQPVEGNAQRDGAGASRLDSAATDLVHLAFQVSGTQPFETFEAVFSDADGQPIFETGPFSQRRGFITVSVRREALPPGTTRITLYGLDEGSRVSIGTYELVRDEGDSP